MLPVVLKYGDVWRSYICEWFARYVSFGRYLYTTGMLRAVRVCVVMFYVGLVRK